MAFRAELSFLFRRKDSPMPKLRSNLFLSSVSFIPSLLKKCRKGIFHNNQFYFARPPGKKEQNPNLPPYKEEIRQRFL